jgi:hypothetical protein
VDFLCFNGEECFFDFLDPESFFFTTSFLTATGADCVFFAPAVTLVESLLICFTVKELLLKPYSSLRFAPVGLAALPLPLYIGNSRINLPSSI